MVFCSCRQSVSRLNVLCIKRCSSGCLGCYEFLQSYCCLPTRLEYDDHSPLTSKHFNAENCCSLCKLWRWLQQVIACFQSKSCKSVLRSTCFKEHGSYIGGNASPFLVCVALSVCATARLLVSKTKNYRKLWQSVDSSAAGGGMEQWVQGVVLGGLVGTAGSHTSISVGRRDWERTDRDWSCTTQYWMYVEV